MPESRNGQRRLEVPPEARHDGGPWHLVTAGEYTSLGASLDGTPGRLEGRIVGAWQDLGTGSEPELSILTTTR